MHENKHTHTEDVHDCIYARRTSKQASVPGGRHVIRCVCLRLQVHWETEPCAGSDLIKTNCSSCYVTARQREKSCSLQVPSQSDEAPRSFHIALHAFPTTVACGHKYWSLAHLITNTCHLNGLHHYDHLLFDNRRVSRASQNGRMAISNTGI